MDNFDLYLVKQKFILTRSIRDSQTSIDFVQGSPGSRKERVKELIEWFSARAARA